MQASIETATSLFFANSVVLITHEIDSAYWHEWELFRFPGGIQLFLVINVVLVGLVLYGYRAVVLWSDRAKLYSYLLAAIGIFAALVHGAILLAGSLQFRLPVSIVLLVVTFGLSVGQVLVVRNLGR